ncbi:hypothetical protein N9E21_04895 [Candidatus Poseidoniaceae archaeon]|nr:hypothetical protein [Candidatus Poseidoniaceae archaeon]
MPGSENTDTSFWKRRLHPSVVHQDEISKYIKRLFKIFVSICIFTLVSNALEIISTPDMVLFLTITALALLSTSPFITLRCVKVDTGSMIIIAEEKTLFTEFSEISHTQYLEDDVIGISIRLRRTDVEGARRDYWIVLIREGEDPINLIKPYGWKMVSQIANSIASRSGLRLDLEPIWFNSIKD